jgi:hypothetical protein
VPVELALVETDSFPKNLLFGRLRHAEFLVQMSQSLRKREIERKLDKANQVAATAAAVAIEDIFGSIDVERWVTLGM